jgi:hypothetical protein
VNEVEAEDRRLAAEDARWNEGAKLHMLLLATFLAALAVIYAISSFKSGDWTWEALSHDPVREAPPSGW